MIVGVFNTPLSIIDKNRKKISKDTENLNNTFNKFDLAEIHRIFTLFKYIWNCLQDRSYPRPFNKLKYI